MRKTTKPPLMIDECRLTNPRVEQYGSVQPEYVVVPDALLAKTKELKPFFDASLKYVASLKPKPTTRKKKG